MRLQSVSELGCISEGALTMGRLHFGAAGYPKENSMLVSERPQESSISIFQPQMNLFVKKKKQFQNKNLE